jgi:hypothetical protein
MSRTRGVISSQVSGVPKGLIKRPLSRVHVPLEFYHNDTATFQNNDIWSSEIPWQFIFEDRCVLAS